MAALGRSACCRVDVVDRLMSRKPWWLHAELALVSCLRAFFFEALVMGCAALIEGAAVAGGCAGRPPHCVGGCSDAGIIPLRELLGPSRAVWRRV